MLLYLSQSCCGHQSLDTCNGVCAQMRIMTEFGESTSCNGLCDHISKFDFQMDVNDMTALKLYMSRKRWSSVNDSKHM